MHIAYYIFIVFVLFLRKIFCLHKANEQDNSLRFYASPHIDICLFIVPQAYRVVICMKENTALSREKY